MSYAIRNDGLGWRAINSRADLMDGEIFSKDQPPAPIIAPDLKAEALAYLASTDWYIVRFVETQKPVPDDVLDKRAEARLVE
jgi:hypothetical protein